MARVLVPLAAGCEEIEAVTVIDLLRRAGIEVVTASLEPGTIVASRGVKLQADTTLDEVSGQSFDLVALPGGGPGADNLQNDGRVSDALHRAVSGGAYVAAICAAPKVLAAAGLLDGKRATGYPGVLEGLDLPRTRLTGAPVEIDGKIVTSRGPGTAMDFALTLVGLLAGDDKQREIEAQLQRS